MLTILRKKKKQIIIYFFYFCFQICRKTVGRKRLVENGRSKTVGQKRSSFVRKTEIEIENLIIDKNGYNDYGQN